MALAAERDGDAFVPETFTPESIANADLVHEIDSGLLEYAGANALDHVLLAAIFHDERMNAAEVQQVAEHQARRPGADDADLRPNLLHIRSLRLPQRPRRTQKNVFSPSERGGQDHLEHRAAIFRI